MSESYTYKNEKVLLPEGDYEVKIDDIGIIILPSGKKKLSIRFRVRDDIEGQAYGNKCLFEDIWPEKESPEHFNRKRINQLLGTQDVKEGTVFDTIYDIMEYLRANNCLIVHISIRFDEYQGEDVNRIAYYKSSKKKPHTLEEVKVEVVSDDGLPF